MVTKNTTETPFGQASPQQVLTAMVYGTFNISGAQLNPAVTFALTLLGKKCLGHRTKKDGLVLVGFGLG